jgi:hypothetical protein
MEREQMGAFQTPATDTVIPGSLLGTVTAFDVIDSTENEKTVLLEVGEPFQVVVNWTLAGIFVPIVGGTWEVALYIDDIGVGSTAGQLGATKILPVKAGSGTPPVVQGPAIFNIPGGTVTEGVYQIIATINHCAQGFPQGTVTEMVGFTESTPVKFTTTVIDPN